MDIKDLTGKVALVTGAGSGIGRATALAFASRGADLVLCDVDGAGLDATEKQVREAGRQALSRKVDVANRNEMAEFAEEVHAQLPALDILMNNAGVGLGASFLDSTLEDWDWIVGVNLMGVVHGCHFFVPRMVERGQGGHVVNVASAAYFISTEALAAYGTTKYGVVGLSEALRAELARHRIGVTAVCPGIVKTNITQSIRLRGDQANPALRAQMIRTYERRNYGPERVAAGILTAIGRNRALAPISPESWTLYLLKRLSPGFVGFLNRQMSRQATRRVARLEN